MRRTLLRDLAVVRFNFSGFIRRRLKSGIANKRTFAFESDDVTDPGNNTGTEIFIKTLSFGSIPTCPRGDVDIFGF